MAGLVRRIIERDADEGNAAGVEAQLEVSLLNGDTTPNLVFVLETAARAHGVSGPLDTEFQYRQRIASGREPLEAWAEVASRSYAAQRMPSDADRVVQILAIGGVAEPPEVLAHRILARGLAGDLAGASALWPGMDAPTAVQVGLISAHLHNGRLDDALALTKRLTDQSDGLEAPIAAYSAIVSHLVARGQVEEAAVVTHEANDAGVELDDSTARALKIAQAAAAVQDGEDVSLAMPDGLRLLSAVLGMILHEISQPVVRIEANIETARYLLERDEPADAQAVLTDRLQPAIGTLQARLEVYRAISKERLRDASKSWQATPEEVVSELKAMVEAQARDAGVALHVQIAPTASGAVIDADPFILAFGLRQLVGNAIQAHRREESDRPWVSVEVSLRGALGGQRSDSVLFVVADNGPGIPHEQLAQAVTLGFTTRGGGGMGMGLTLAQSVAVHYGGELTIGATSEGARLVVRVPVAEDGAGVGAVRTTHSEGEQ